MHTIPVSALTFNAPVPYDRGSLQSETHTFPVGDTFLWSESPASRYAVALEDDGETGYLYGVELRDGEQSVLDALLLYNVDEVSAGQVAVATLVWSDEGERVALWLNGRQEAAFDFARGRAVCRSNFPPASEFTRSHRWDGSLAGDLVPPAPAR